MSGISIESFGAKAEPQFNNSAAIQKAIDSLAESGGGTVIVPAGKTFMTGSILLKSNINLHLEPGSKLLASPDITEYTDWSKQQVFSEVDFARFWIFACNEENVSITGPGTFDGNSQSFTKEYHEENNIAKNPRAQSVVLLGCRSVHIRDITIRNAPSWALRPCGCTDVVIDGISIYSDRKLVNTDGIDPDCCKNVRISNCHIETGDDGICVKTRKEIAKEYGTCENIAITNCTVASSCVAIKIGTESYADIRNVIVSNCVVFDSHRGLAVDGRDSSRIENVIFTNCIVETKLSDPVWWHEGEPIYICQVPRPAGETPANVRNVRFSDIFIQSESGVYIQGHPSAIPESIELNNVKIRISKKTRFQGGFMDPRPCDPEFLPPGSKGFADKTPWGSKALHDIPGIFLDQLKNVTIRNCEITWGEDLPSYYSYVLESHSVAGLITDGLTGSSARPGMPSQVVS